MAEASNAGVELANVATNSTVDVASASNEVAGTIAAAAVAGQVLLGASATLASENDTPTEDQEGGEAVEQTGSDATDENPAELDQVDSSPPAPSSSRRSSTSISSRLTDLKSSIKSTTQPVWDVWKSYGPLVHVAFVILELLVMGWELHGMRTELKQHQQPLQAYAQISNDSTVAIEHVNKELHALRLQAIEQEKWRQMHDYVQGCLAYIKADVQNAQCQDALKQVGIAPPFVPENYSVSISLVERDLKKVPTMTSTLLASRPSNGSFSINPTDPLNLTLAVSMEPKLTLRSLIAAAPAFVFILFVIAKLVWPRLRGVLETTFAKFKKTERFGRGSTEVGQLPEMAQRRITPSVQTPESPVLVSGAQSSALNNLGRARRRHVAKTKTIWHEAMAGNWAAIQQHFYDQGEVDARDQDHGTLLAAAAQGSKLLVAQRLIEKGADVNATNCKFGTPLHSAVFSKSEALVELLLDKGADINAYGPSGSPLMLCVEKGFEELANILIKRGAEINTGNDTYGSVLQAATARELPALVHYLLDKGADVNCADGIYGSPLQIAASEDKVELVKYLIQRRADLEVKSATRGTPLQIACLQGFTDVAITLIEKGADVTVKDDQKKTPLHDAARLGRARLAEALLQTGRINVNAQDADLWAPLHHASVLGFDEIVKLLLDADADTTIADKFHAHALFRAAGLGHAKCVEMLLQKGSPVNAVDCFGRSALHGPPQGDDLSVPILLLDAGADVNLVGSDGKTAIHEAAHTGNEADLQLLLDRGAVTNIQDNDQATPLHRAVTHNFEGCVMKLLQAPDVDVNARQGGTLQAAVIQGNINIVKALLGRGAVVNAQGGQYGSATGAAAVTGNLAILDVLAAEKASPNIVGGEFGTPLQAAAWNGHLDALKWLLAHGAHPNTTAGRYGCALNAATAALEAAHSQGLSTTSDDFETREEIVSVLKDDYGARALPYNTHKDERWKLTPGGWNWLVKGDH